MAFEWYIDHRDRLKPEIPFCQFWDDFLINYMIWQEVPIEETFQKTCDKLELEHEHK
ncbi:hypothetical protein SAMN05443246_5275 [Paenibacillus sp. GP183]|jgi:hypothetical protein|nr:hypothetical protein SAMN05443246_5275 [Paenibacillus sp. GP183]